MPLNEKFSYRLYINVGKILVSASGTFLDNKLHTHPFSGCTPQLCCTYVFLFYYCFTVSSTEGLQQHVLQP